jgi:ATP-dependent RNA helicase RhlE
VSFTSFNLDPQIVAGVKALGYTAPTPIQRQAIPPVLEGKDVMGLAQTGTGKTAAFVLPILERLMKGPRGRVRSLIIAPTRELAEQIHESINALGFQTKLRSMTIYGGVGVNPQIQKLRAGVDIVVACPGRLLDHINQGTINLAQTEVLVLDEADRMFDMGFLPDIRRIL